MLLLVSPIDLSEARAASVGGADIIDVKNPAEGSLGANYPWVIEEIKKALPPHAQISATIGDLTGKPGSASQAAYGLSKIGVNYIKAGLLVTNQKEAEKIAEAITKATEKTKSKIILAAYADYKDTCTINPQTLPDIAEKTGAHGVMIDTYNKNGKTLFDHMTTEELTRFTQTAKTKKLITALAGTIQQKHIPKLKKINPDIIGIRSAVCTKNDRVNGKIEKDKVKQFKQQINQ
ncbi:hypothetical protein BMS3Abin16_01069 [archaeon BMS3Abin16]|nr:hypothetical protein BMS3Abin16_01069 [archaeon BMS3Abin16]GBE56440.1 hypothetical protein BMS3Bbin16_00645 [archaeon BMS3Bbin16]HDY73597.1 hypothetical protein [Euryarchaeota archaeon]